MGISHMHGLVSGETIMLLEDHCHLERGQSYILGVHFPESNVP